MLCRIGNMASGEDVNSVAVERALAILEAVASRDVGMTNSEISRRLAIPKSTASYILKTLERTGYLHREPTTAKYQLGLKVLSLGRGVSTGSDLRQVALPIMTELVSRTNLTAHLAVIDHGEVVYIAKVESPGFLKTDTWVGGRMLVHTTAVGKAIAAHLPLSEVERIIKERGLRQRTPKSITTHTALLRDLEKVRSRGYAVDDEENSLGARCIGAPVMDGFGKVLGAIGVSGSTGQIDGSSLRTVAEAVVESARLISKQFGYLATAG
jgi:IclR family KDG regulon transcriptional repressor